MELFLKYYQESKKYNIYYNYKVSKVINVNFGFIDMIQCFFKIKNMA